MGDGDDVYPGLEFGVWAEFEEAAVVDRSIGELRVETQGCIMNALGGVSSVQDQRVNADHPGAGPGGRYKVRVRFSNPLDPTEYTALHSTIKQALTREAEDVDWLKALAPEWEPKAPPG